jgi:hypothetical protein
MDTDTDPDMTMPKQARPGHIRAEKLGNTNSQDESKVRGMRVLIFLCRSGNEAIVVFNKITKATNKEGQRASAPAEGLTF